MPLIEFWNSNPSAFEGMGIEQIVAMAGDGNLTDGSRCSEEFRDYLSQIPSARIARYVESCLSSGFQRSGMVLQDLVNELGRRLDYKVSNGRYQGNAKEIGFDGIWISPEEQTIIVEVKTTDTYRISLDTISTYRDRLLREAKIANPSSIIIVVGRQDTGELEAQVRGSRHAWDIRLVSTNALIKLVHLKENADDPETSRKIRSVLVPAEYTRLDHLIDVVFTTAADIETAGRDSAPEIEESAKSHVELKDSDESGPGMDVQRKRDQVVDAMGRKLSVQFVKNSRALYWDSKHEARVACTISKRYPSRTYQYWYAYHPQWDEFLRDGSKSYFVLGCTDQPFAFAVPWTIIHGVLDKLNTTTTDRTTYWHINVAERPVGKFSLQLTRGASPVVLDDFRIPLTAARATFRR